MQVYCQWIHISTTLQWWSNNSSTDGRSLFLETALCIEITKNSFGWWCMKIILKGPFEGGELKKKRSRDKACGVVVISWVVSMSKNAGKSMMSLSWIYFLVHFHGLGSLCSAQACVRIRSTPEKGNLNFELYACCQKTKHMNNIKLTLVF